MRQAIVLIMELGGDYGTSIPANKVARPVLAHDGGFRAGTRLQQFEDAMQAMITSIHCDFTPCAHRDPYGCPQSFVDSTAGLRDPYLHGYTAIEVKCELRPEDSLTRTLRQVLACALADSDDEPSIESIGVYHAYEGSLVHWPLARAPQSLSATGHASLPELRAPFADTIATERRSIEEQAR